MKILIVDPFPWVRQSIAVLLKNMGFEMTVTEVGEYHQSLSFIRQNRFDLVIVSASLRSGFDDIDGLKIVNFCKHLYNGTMGVRTILLAPYFDFQLRAQAADAGANAILTMPLRHLEDFAIAVNTALETSPSQAQTR